MLRHGEMGVLQVDPVVLLRHLDRLIPLPTGHMQLAQQVVPPALLVELLGIVYHVQLDGHHGQLGLQLVLHVSLPHHSGTPSETHIPQTDLRHVQTLGLHTHLRHVLPDVVVLDVPHAVVGLVHVPHRQVERKVHDRLLRHLIHILQPQKVLHRPPQNYHVGSVGLLLALFVLLVFVLILLHLSAHEVEVRHRHPQQGLIPLLELDRVLLLHLVVRGHKIGLQSLPSELFFLLLEVILDFVAVEPPDLIAQVPPSASIHSLRNILDVFGLNGKEARVVLVPEALTRDPIGCDFHLHEVVHVNIIDVELGVWDPDGGERRLVGEDAEFLAVGAEGDVFDLSEGLSGLDFELPGDSDLLVLPSGDVEDLDHVVRRDHRHVPVLHIHQGHFPLALSHR
mmetsp:Transcript_22979/g.22332  ORF Transcript_22979/g.22332 Transcript_22979/m.22332 type:complete len:395 (-) Transcript_22979:1471-2655(-)